MVKTIVLLLSVMAAVVTAIEDNVMEFGRFRVLKQKSRSGWMQNKFTRRDQALCKRRNKAWISKCRVRLKPTGLFCGDFFLCTIDRYPQAGTWMASHG
jgi:hypothetical protein